MRPLPEPEQPTNGLYTCSNGHTNEATHGIAEDDSSRITTIESSSIPSHPLGVKPLGNQYISSGVNARQSLGSLQQLPDEMLSQLLEYFDQRSVRLLGYACKFAFALCYSDDLWKSLFLESHMRKPRPFVWKGTWRSTVLELTKENEAQVDCSNVFSDVMHRPFVCSHIALGLYVSGIPKSNEIRRFKDLSYDEFASQWSSQPFILTECIRPWPATQTWNMDMFLQTYSEVEFRAEAVDWPFAIYYQYMTNNQDESPLYLFDKKFAEKMRIKEGRDDPDVAYWKPDCFGPDLFELLGAERPAHRWLIIGPKRSGSTFHKDPNSTSAWNAVVQGSKYWIMFPPSVSVPGVYVSADNSEVTSPLSIAEWLLEFHAEARQLPECQEGICHAGEILHVPSGWWHLVVNLEDAIAVTQNFVPKSHLADVLSFLKYKADQVTGFKRSITDPYGLFIQRIEAEYPALLEEALGEVDRREGKRKRKWEAATGVHGDKKPVFSFGFAAAEEDEVP